MNELIRLTRRAIGDTETNAVSGRDLHTFLGIGKDFTSWAKDQIDAFCFVEHIDFECAHIAPQIRGAICGHMVDYFMTISMAKELAMVSRSPRGKEARLYFIECERMVIEASKAKVPQTLSEALRMAADALDAKATLEAKVAADAPKVEFALAVRNSDDAITVAKFGKLIGMGEITLFRRLRAEGILFKKGNDNIPYQEYVDRGYFKVVENAIKTTNHGDILTLQTLITGKGQAWVQRRLKVSAPAPELGLSEVIPGAASR